MNGKRMRKYTLIELLAVVVIVAMLATLMAVGFNGVRAHWCTANTVASMKQIELVLDNFRQQQGYLPESEKCSSSHAEGLDKQETTYHGIDQYPLPRKIHWKKENNSFPNWDLLVDALLQAGAKEGEVSLFAIPSSEDSTIPFKDDAIAFFDGYSHKAKIYYVYPYTYHGKIQGSDVTKATGTFALFSKGEDGKWDSDFANSSKKQYDDVIFLPNGIPGKLAPGAYLVSLNKDGGFNVDDGLEQLDQ